MTQNLLIVQHSGNLATCLVWWRWIFRSDLWMHLRFFKKNKRQHAAPILLSVGQMLSPRGSCLHWQWGRHAVLQSSALQSVEIEKNEKLQKALIIRHHGYIIRHYVLLWLFAIAIFWEIMVFQFKTIMKQEAMIRITACKNCRPIGTYSCNITE